MLYSCIKPRIRYRNLEAFMRLEMAASQVSFNIKVAKSADGNQGNDE